MLTRMCGGGRGCHFKYSFKTNGQNGSYSCVCVCVCMCMYMANKQTNKNNNNQNQQEQEQLRLQKSNNRTDNARKSIHASK